MNPSGLRERTLIVFAGDNGTAKGSISRAEKSGDRWQYLREPVYAMWRGQRVRGGKTNLTDDGTNVPLICNWTGTIKPGGVVDDLVDFSDFHPTFGELGRSDPSRPPGIDGLSFARRLLGAGSGPRQWAFAQKGGQHWVRTPRWKLYNDGRFFEVASDRYEKNNLSDSVPSAAADPKSMLQRALQSL